MQSAEELQSEVQRLTEMRDRLLETLNEQGAARAEEHEAMRGMRDELVWRRKEMGEAPHGKHDFQRPGVGLERRCMRCEIRYSQWFGGLSCPADEPTPQVRTVDPLNP